MAKKWVLHTHTTVKPFSNIPACKMQRTSSASSMCTGLSNSLDDLKKYSPLESATYNKKKIQNNNNNNYKSIDLF